ncbi:MAG: hypothetical protein G01um1014106_126 [Parcubacteria group bacterium Gr01-1014_106]|nr:MAG: hypothetical protein G01um1014106_126 [Parcubacteria group bacterium Gr01-1014_106]
MNTQQPARGEQHVVRNGRRRTGYGFQIASSAGFTILETALVITIIAILLALIVPVSQQFQTNALLHTEAAALAADLRRVQTAASAGTNDTAHGLHVDITPTDQWVLFRGSTYVPGAAENAVHALPTSVDITTVALTGGGQDILFTERRGTTSTPGTMTLRTANGQTKTVSVNGRGVVDIE